MFSRFFIQRPIFACVISIAIVLAGAIAQRLLPVEQTPDITPPTVSVSTSYPGASAEVVADTVAAVIEEEVNGVEDMIYMSSKCSNDGKYDLTVSFEVGTDVDMATVLVQNRVKIAEPKLPEEVKREGVKTEKRSTNIVLMVNLYSPEGTYDEIQISNYVSQNVKDVLSRVKGVGKVDVMGAKDYGMRIWLNPEELKARGLTTNDVVDVIREQNVQVAAGQIGAPPSPKGQQFQYTVNTLGRLTDKAQFENMILKVGEQGRVLRVKDVARVELGAQAYNWSVELNGAPSIAVNIYQLPGENALEVAEGIRERMRELEKAFPEGLDYKIAYDTTMFVTASIKEVIETLLIAVVLVVLTVYVFLQDFRTTLIPAVTIPVALVGTFTVMLVMGLSVNTLTLFGLVLAIGIVVDDAIVVVENTVRIMEDEGLGAKEAVAKAMDQVSGPVIATTLVLLAVFVPTAMMGGITGRLYQQFALTIATATVFSSINALTLSPALCGVLLKRRDGRPSGGAAVLMWLYDRTIGLFFRGFEWGFGYTTSGYMWAVNMVVRRTAIVMVLFLGLVALTVFGFTEVPTGFIPDEDQGYFMVTAQLPDGATLERTEQVVDQINRMLKETPGVADVIGVVGYSALDSLAVPNSGTLFVVLEDWEDRKEPPLKAAAILRTLQVRLNTIQEAIVMAFAPPPITGLGNAGGFEFQLQNRGGTDLAELEMVGQELVHEGYQDPVLTRMYSNFRASVPQLYLDVDRTKVKKLGVPLQSVFSTLQAYLGSAYVNDFNLSGRVYKVMVQADKDFRSRVEDINRLYVRNDKGDMVPLPTLLSIRDTAGPQTIFRFNMYPSATITGQANVGYSSGQAIAAMEQLSARVLPREMGYEWSGVTFQQIQAGNQAPLIFAMALVFVFLFLAAQYESWSIPLAVMFSVPLAILGAIAGTWLRALDNNIYTQIALVLLIGLASKSAILIVEFAKQRRAEGHSIIDAAVEASRLRFRAILMTAFSFILGVVPLLIASGAGAASRRSLGTAVFGGMLAATVFGVFLIPVLYVVVQRISELVRRPRDET